jgi:hypothetical protein
MSSSLENNVDCGCIETDRGLIDLQSQEKEARENMRKHIHYGTVFSIGLLASIGGLCIPDSGSDANRVADGVLAILGTINGIGAIKDYLMAAKYYFNGNKIRNEMENLYSD